ncbi:MAG: hypothetical protein B6I29_02790 [Marinitoga sp. 4572_148]|nr:MAG: hypothetical protein B6I29_02790 [Marinitoga sp. 4572_148]
MQYLFLYLYFYKILFWRLHAEQLKNLYHIYFSFKISFVLPTTLKYNSLFFSSNNPGSIVNILFLKLFIISSSRTDFLLNNLRYLFMEYTAALLYS